MTEQEWPTDWEILADDMWDGIPLMQMPGEDTGEQTEEEEEEQESES